MKEQGNTKAGLITGLATLIAFGVNLITADATNKYGYAVLLAGVLLAFIREFIKK